MKTLILCLLLSIVANAQAVDGPAPAPDRFFSKGNIARLTFTASAMTADAITTQHFLSPEVQQQYRRGPRELNPIAAPFVNHGWPGQLVASGVSFAAVVTATYIAHRTGHHRIEKLVPLLTGGVSCVAASSNARYYRKQ